jgi:alkylation response protein AidB-like acyl-CoA dehydrogenase
MFDDVKVPKEHIIGQLGEGFKIAMSGLDGGRINIATCRWAGGGLFSNSVLAAQEQLERKRS